MSDKDVRRQDMIYELIQTERGFLRHLVILKLLFWQRLLDSGILSQYVRRGGWGCGVMGACCCVSQRAKKN